MIYLLEDDESIRNFVIYALNSSGMTAQGFELPSQLYSALNVTLPDLLLLDIMLPEEDGLSVLAKIRARDDTKRLPVILLTAKGTEYDKVKGLDEGADDYITKPFGAMELIARIKALMRRASDSVPNRITLGNIAINPESHAVYVGGSEVSLTNKEYSLLLLLIRSRGKAFSRDELLQKVWGFDFSGESRTVDVHIGNLRAKLGDSGDMIETVRGFGYMIGGSK